MVNFPTTLDSLTNPSSSDHLNSVTVKHSTQHSDLNDISEALEAKVGINLSSVANSLDYITNLFLLTQTEHQSGVYAEIEYVSGTVFISKITWYTSAAKTIKLVDRAYTYNSGSPVPATIAMKLYDGTASNTTLRTVTDTISYNNNVFENSRVRSIS